MQPKTDISLCGSELTVNRFLSKLESHMDCMQEEIEDKTGLPVEKKLIIQIIEKELSSNKTKSRKSVCSIVPNKFQILFGKEYNLDSMDASTQLERVSKLELMLEEFDDTDLEELKSALLYYEQRKFQLEYYKNKKILDWINALIKTISDWVPYHPDHRITFQLLEMKAAALDILERNKQVECMTKDELTKMCQHYIELGNKLLHMKPVQIKNYILNDIASASHQALITAKIEQFEAEMCMPAL